MDHPASDGEACRWRLEVCPRHRGQEGRNVGFYQLDESLEGIAVVPARPNSGTIVPREQTSLLLLDMRVDLSSC